MRAREYTLGTLVLVSLICWLVFLAALLITIDSQSL